MDTERLAAALWAEENIDPITQLDDTNLMFWWNDEVFPISEEYKNEYRARAETIRSLVEERE